MLCGKSVVLDSARFPEPFLISMCLIAISKDFFEIVLPNPELSGAVVEALTDLLATTSGACDTFLGSGTSA